MAERVFCDFCDEGPLHPSTGRYIVVIQKTTKIDADGRKYTEEEFDVCGACVARLRTPLGAAKKGQ